MEGGSCHCPGLPGGSGLRQRDLRTSLEPLAEETSDDSRSPTSNRVATPPRQVHAPPKAPCGPGKRSPLPQQEIRRSDRCEASLRSSRLAEPPMSASSSGSSQAAQEPPEDRQHSGMPSVQKKQTANHRTEPVRPDRSQEDLRKQAGKSSSQATVAGNGTSACGAELIRHDTNFFTRPMTPRSTKPSIVTPKEEPGGGQSSSNEICPELLHPYPCTSSAGQPVRYRIIYYFRGAWSEYCQEQLTLFAELAETFRADGMEIIAITAQPGGDDFIRSKLSEAGVPPLPFPVISDPAHKMLEPTAGDIFTITRCPGNMGSYNMVQSTLVIVDLANGETIKECSWSWKTVGVQNTSWSKNDFLKQKPDLMDIAAAVKGKRPVKFLTQEFKDWRMSLAFAIINMCPW
eukprot:TRINITY_DN29428_c0_g2_i1.p1 TRINITY_DN29428_c0_g2~~TRINITY_DN29428_c0_g2_i1.p1  ORF type:complete len:402 (-),score=48.56 TRINITY_DN29428_c0_g2_i1:345-1550(-)